MKQLFIWLLTIFTAEILHAQNLIQNGDFELCNGDPSCSSLPNSQSQTNYLQGNWGVIAGTTPDWYDNTTWNNNEPGLGQEGCGPSAPPVRAESGTHYIGIYDNEGITYDCGSVLKDGPYTLTFWIHGSPPLDNSITNWGIVVYGSDKPLTNSNSTLTTGCGIDGNRVVLSETIYAANDYAGWRQVSVTFWAFHDERPAVHDKEIRYITFTGYRDGQGVGCGITYQFLDNVYMQSICCGNYMLYQDCDYLPPVTQRTQYIKAGYNVGCNWQWPGEVNVESNQNVLFQAPDVEATYTQGFNVVPGGVYTMQPSASCEQIGPLSNYDIDLIYFPQAIDFNCNPLNPPGVTQTNGTFACTGANYYMKLIYDRWCELIYEKHDFINELYTEYWDGSNTFTSARSGEVVYELTIYNCYQSLFSKGSIYYEYQDGCNPMYKTQSYPDSISQAEGSDFEVYTVPTSSQISIDFSNETNGLVGFSIFNELGQVIKTIEPTIYPQNNILKIDLDAFSSGVYIIQKNDDSGTKTKKFIVAN